MLRRTLLLALLSFAAVATPSAHAQCADKIVVTEIESMKYGNIQIYKLTYKNKSSTPVIVKIDVLNAPADFKGNRLPTTGRMPVGNPIGLTLGQGGVHNFSLSNVKLVYDNQPAPSSGFALSITNCKVTN